MGSIALHSQAGKRCGVHAPDVAAFTAKSPLKAYATSDAGGSCNATRVDRRSWSCVPPAPTDLFRRLSVLLARIQPGAKDRRYGNLRQARFSDYGPGRRFLLVARRPY